MKMQTTTTNAQLGFDSLLAAADETNERHFFLKTVAHLPGTWADALPFYRALLDSHNAAMVEGNDEEVCRLKTEAYDLAVKLSDGVSLGICAPDGYGSKLEREAAAAAGTIPKWGQAGSFVIDHEGMEARVELDGLFGIGSFYDFWPGFKAYAVNRRKPFISDTGFRSFSGYGYSELIPGLTPDQFVGEMLTNHIENQLGGKLVRIKAQTKAKAE